MKLFTNFNRGMASVVKGIASIGEGVADIMAPSRIEITRYTSQHYTTASEAMKADWDALGKDWEAVGGHMRKAMDEVSVGLDKASVHMDNAVKEAQAAARKRT